MASTPTTPDGSTALRSTLRDGPGSYDVPRLGIDAEGDEHFYDDEHDRVLLVSDGDVEEVTDLNGRPFADYVAFIRSERGESDDPHRDVWGDQQWEIALREVREA
jgi:hypothetical protein